MMKRTLVFGKYGQVASEIRELVGADPSFRFLGRSEIPVGDAAALSKLVENLRPDIVINCAAYTAVDKAESEPDACYALNRDFVGQLATATNQVEATLIHFSTDYVFDGASKVPYKESDRAAPLSVYGASKLAGEIEVHSIAKSATILRTSWVYSKYGANFVKTIIRLANEEKELKVVNDQHGSPTWAAELASLVVNHLQERKPGVDIFHVSGQGETTWNGFAREIADVWKTHQRDIAGIPTKDYPTPARRPLYGVLSKVKLKAVFGFETLDWCEALRQSFLNWECV